MINKPVLFTLLLALFFSFASVSWAGLPQGTQTLVRFRRAYLVSNITYPAGVGYYPQWEDDEAQAKALKALSLKQPAKRLPSTSVKKDTLEKAFLTQQETEAVAQVVEEHQVKSAWRKRFSNGLFNILNLVEFGDASLAKRMAVSPIPLPFLDHYDNGEDYLYLPAIGIPLPIRLQSKNTFIH
jgi:hypothetical protein